VADDVEHPPASDAMMTTGARKPNVRISIQRVDVTSAAIGDAGSLR
jgi:hypothetical protein